ncbi:MAG: glycosyltransferase family 4 protein [Candidatus Doudnabacteria bacterium]|nr:glycosyltransferase family 4 protein [Candidatus Doudnabacteria bacterium]
MTIGLEAERANLPNPTGVEVYAAQLIKHLAKLDQRNQYVLYFRTKPQDWFYKLPSNFRIKVMPFPKFWTQLRLSWEMIWHPVDVLVILASALPFIHPKNSIFTAHDIAYEFFPEAFTPFMRNYLIWSTRFAARHAAKIIAVSDSTKHDLVKRYQVSPENVKTIHLAVDHSQLKPLAEGEVKAVLDKFGLEYKKYILFIGTLQPRKNIKRLVDAYIQLKKEKGIEEKLVIAGGKGWLFEPILKKINQAGMQEEIKFLGYIEEADKCALYNGAVALTLPALYEGFGLPPLEAMACGVSVVVSNVSSLPEVVGEAGVMVDPNSTDSIAQGLFKILSDKNLQKELGEKGIARARQFTWAETARKTLALLESLNTPDHPRVEDLGK